MDNLKSHVESIKSEFTFEGAYEWADYSPIPDRQITITFPHRITVTRVGGRLLRKRRLRKKRDKALLALGIATTYNGYITDIKYGPECTQCELRLLVSPSS